MKLAIAIALFILLEITAHATASKNFYKTSHISQSVIGVSCPGNGGEPKVIGTVDGTLLISCGK